MMETGSEEDTRGRLVGMGKRKREEVRLGLIGTALLHVDV
jgi:hypothetical protein